jgi:N-acetylneuraminic acid mutarotase
MEDRVGDVKLIMDNGLLIIGGEGKQGGSSTDFAD